MMLSRRSLLAGAAVLPLSAKAGAAEAGGVSDWVATDHARLRLIDAGADGARRLAGLQIQLDPSYLTYWRTPGEAGVPPVASFEGSRNLGSAVLAFPAPQRFDEGGAEAFGYKDDVVFPLTVIPVDASKPVMLALSLSFAVCSNLCLPANAALSLELAGTGAGLEAGLVRDALARVPVAMPLGSPGPLAIEAVDPGAPPTTVRVVASAPAGTPPALFVETPEPWFIQAGEARAAGEGRWAFELRILAGPKQPARIAAVLTLVASERSIETTAELDASAPTP